MMEECVEETSEVSSLAWWRRLPMAPGSEPGPEPEPECEAGEPSVRRPGDAARRGGVARPRPESAHAHAVRPSLAHSSARASAGDGRFVPFMVLSLHHGIELTKPFRMTLSK